jgi:C1A family cysteine protease
MNKMFLVSIALSSILASCGNRPSTTSNTVYKNKIVLGAYSDMISNPTLDESQLLDLPKLVDLSDEQTPAKNQSDRGTCTIFSVAGLVEAAIKKDLKTEVNLSEEYLNYAVKKIGSYQKIEGSTISENVRGMRAKGLLLEEDWSYQASWFDSGRPCADYKSTDAAAPKTCFSHNKPNQKAMSRLIDARGITVNTLEKDTNAMIRFLATEKRPLIMSVNVNFDGWPSSGETEFNEELRKACLNNSSNCGGHSILVTGYDMKKRVFMFKNSWGNEWGKNGHGTIPFDVVDNYVTETLYYATVTGDLTFPEEKSPELKLNRFDVESVKDIDNSIYVVVDADVKDTSGKMVYISSYLVKKSKNYVMELPTDGNSELVRVPSDEEEIVGDTYARTSMMRVPQEENDFKIDSNEVGASLLMTAQMMSVPSIDKLIRNTDYDKYLRTTIYVHTDDSAFKVLKRTYTPVQ